MAWGGDCSEGEAVSTVCVGGEGTEDTNVRVEESDCKFERMGATALRADRHLLERDAGGVTL